MSASNSSVTAIHWQGDHLQLLDQRQLPEYEIYLSFTRAHELSDAIRSMIVRGAPAIGITAAYGIALSALRKQDTGDWNQALKGDFEGLAASRPTAVNLFWALQRMRNRLHWLIGEGADGATIAQQLVKEAIAIHQEDIAANLAMGKLGASLIEANSEVYTHCNAGALATGGFGTALGVIRTAHQQGLVKKVYAGETRPWLQGARLTAWELMQDNIPVTLSCEGAAGQLLNQGKVRWVIIGADRIAANGDVANKVGSYNLAILAKYHNVKFMVVAPSSTFDLTLENGSDIPIEQRPATEVTHLQGKAISPDNCLAINPSFDVTPATLVDVIVTEKGIIEQPNAEKIQRVLNG
jgi:methylthioribose-1-phosphate isomerase